MRIITINVNDKTVELIKMYTDNGIYPSRSELIRVAIRDFLIKEAKLYKEYIDPILETDNTIKIHNGNGKYITLKKMGFA